MGSPSATGRGPQTVRLPLAGTLDAMAFERPAPDLQKLISAWEQFEAGEEAPGRVLANLKTAGLGELLQELAASGWTPAGTA